MTLRVTIGEYADFFSEWYGLKDGTILPLSDPRGKMWRKFGDDEPKEIHYRSGE